MFCHFHECICTVIWHFHERIWNGISHFHEGICLSAQSEKVEGGGMGKKRLPFQAALYIRTQVRSIEPVSEGVIFLFRTPPTRSAAGQSEMPSSAARFASAAQMRSMPSKLFARSANTP